MGTTFAADGGQWEILVERVKVFGVAGLLGVREILYGEKSWAGTARYYFYYEYLTLCSHQFPG